MDAEKGHLRTLVIEDAEDDALLLLDELKKGGYIPSHTRVETPESLIEVMQNQEWDVVFCHYSMPNMKGTQALEIVRQINHYVPFIFVSGTIGEDVAVKAVRSGAQDYLMKGNLKRLASTVQRELNEARNRKERHEIKKQLHFLANYDQLTRLPNRLRFQKLLDVHINYAKNNNQLTAVIHLGLDRFKTVNNNIGYKAGDMLLQQVSQRLGRYLNPDDMVARLTADEFAILLPKPKSREATRTIMESVQNALEEPYGIHGCQLYITASMGVAFYPYDAGNANDLLRNADIALNHAKDSGGRSYHFFERRMAVQMEERLALEASMRQALGNGEFTLQYQPLVRLNGHQIIGVEALVRWNYLNGTIQPERLLSLAGETGLIIPLSEWVLEEVCKQATHWRDAGLQPLKISVNISSHHFHQGSLPGLVEKLLDEYGLAPGWLQLEISESGVMQDTDMATATLKRLQKMGVAIVLDDFGSGNSSFNYLKDAPIDLLKIDRSFVANIPADKNNAAITSAMIAMAGKLGMQVAAKGVETREQLDFLRSEGCDYIQGFYLYSPMEPEHFESVLRKQALIEDQPDSLHSEVC